MALVSSCSYCYSEIVHEVSQNAAQNGNQWVMSNVLPNILGLKVQSVLYQYTTIKQPNDNMIVSVQNELRGGNGYVFRSVDDWSGLPGNTIKKFVPVDNISYELWGDGMINVQGNGLVVDAKVQYNYSYNPCSKSQLYSATCPGYNEALLKSVNYSLDFKDHELDNVKFDTFEYYSEKDGVKDAETLDREHRESRKRINKADNKLTNINLLSQQQIIESMNMVPKFDSYYNFAMVGGNYSDATGYKTSKLPDSKKALGLGMAQQLLHDKMVNQQYKQ